VYFIQRNAEFAKLHMGLVVLVKKMPVFINFLLKNSNLVSQMITLGCIKYTLTYCKLLTNDHIRLYKVHTDK
jgi:hypothetical protein